MAPFEFGISPVFDADAAGAAAVGGALLGMSVVFKTALTGNVLGVSGITRGLLSRTPSVAGRVAFLLGLASSGVAMALAYGGLEPMPPPSISSRSRVMLGVRCAVGGLLVGLGTALGNGCTSGHGLTGLARLSVRSWFAVPVFMATAVVTATVCQTAGGLPPDPSSEADMPSVAAAAAVAGGVGLALAIYAGASPKLGPLLGWASEPVAELLSGLAFGCGLVVSTMARPSKVAGFVDVASGAWDPSLAFVMGAALLVTFPFFQLLECYKVERTLLTGSFHLPGTTAKFGPVPYVRGAIDWPFAIGNVLFGLGWGICGMCPGPMWVLITARPSVETSLAWLGMLAGMGSWAAGKKFASSKAVQQEEPCAPAEAPPA